jgi:DNA-binding CsgD family transcriptional regulator
MPREQGKNAFFWGIGAISGRFNLLGTEFLRQIPRELQDAYLTPREKDVIRCLSTGITPKATARRLGISITTVYELTSRAMRQLHSNKYDLIYKAHKMGLVQ